MCPQGWQHRHAITAIRRGCLRRHLLSALAASPCFRALCAYIDGMRFCVLPPAATCTMRQHQDISIPAAPIVRQREAPAQFHPEGFWRIRLGCSSEPSSLPALPASCRLLRQASSVHDMTMSGLQPSTCTKGFVFKLLQRPRSLGFARSGQASMMAFAIMAAALGPIPSRAHHSWRAGIRNTGSC